MEVYREICTLLEAGQNCVLLTVIDRKGTASRGVGARMLLTADGRTFGSIGGGSLEQHSLAEARRAMATGRILRYSHARSAGENGAACSGEVTVLIEPLAPEPQLLIIGSGHVGRSLASIAAAAAFRPVLVDDRAMEESSGIVTLQVESLQTLSGQLTLGKEGMVIICTRSHDLDLAVLRQALASPVGFIGLLGSRRKRAHFEETLLAEGLSPGELARIHCPVGLDIGAETPREIAVSIVAQLVAHRRHDPAA